MRAIGLTGNIAAGKSAVARVWRELGATVVDADELARRAAEPGTPAHARIAEQWGSAVFDDAGALDRTALRGIVFTDPEARRTLEQIVHPAVATLRAEAHDAARERRETTVVDEIPLLFEAGLVGEFDVIVLVDAPAEVRRERLVRTRGLEPAEAQRIIDAQMPAALKRARADIIIENTGSADDLAVEAAHVWHDLAAGG